jgi:hypothetical protein
LSKMSTPTAEAGFITGNPGVRTVTAEATPVPVTAPVLTTSKGSEAGLPVKVTAQVKADPLDTVMDGTLARATKAVDTALAAAPTAMAAVVSPRKERVKVPPRLEPDRANCWIFEHTENNEQRVESVKQEPQWWNSLDPMLPCHEKCNAS